MSVSSSIKDTLIEKINALSSTQTVYGYHRNNPTGFPAVTVVANNMDGEFTSTAENRRSYSYEMLVMYPVGKDIPEIDNLPINEKAENVISETVEDIIDALDDDFSLTGNANALFSQAADASWGFVDYEGGIAKACRITVVVESDYNVTT